MVQENVYERRGRAKKEEEEARRDVEALVAKFLKTAEQLHEWNRVGFEYRNSEGSSVKTNAEPKYVIRIADVPTLSDVCKAIDTWRDVAHKLSAIRSNLTDDERRNLELGPR